MNPTVSVARARIRRRPAAARLALLVAALTVASLPASAHGQEAPPPPPPPRTPVADAAVQGPLPGTVPGDPKAADIADTYPFFSTDVDLAGNGYVEEEFTYSGAATAYSTTGAVTGTGVPYKTRMIVRRPARQKDFNGVVLVEWQNVSAGYDLDALWNYQHLMREGYAWVGVSAQRVGVNQLKGWSPARYGDLDTTGAGTFNADELSYDIYAQAGQAIWNDGAANKRRPGRSDGGVLGALVPRMLFSVGASQSAGRMTVYYQSVLPQVEPVFDAYAFVVGSAPTRVGDEPVFHLLSETDVRTPQRAPDTDQYRRWEVAGAAHSGWNGAEYRQSISVRDLGAAPTYECAKPPYSRVPMHHITGVAYEHLVRWVDREVAPPTAPTLEFNADGTKARDELGLAKGGIRLSQVAAPTALNTGENSGPTFCGLFGTYVPFTPEQLTARYPDHATYVSQVTQADRDNVRQGYLTRADARLNLQEATRADVPPAPPTAP